MDPVVIVTLVAAVPAYVGLAFSVFVFVRQQGEQERRNRWERQFQEQQVQLQLTSSQPNVASVGLRLPIDGPTVPQRLRLVNGNSITIQNQGNSMPVDVAAVVFPVGPAPDAPEQVRRESSYRTYGEGALDASPAANQMLDLVLQARNFPLLGTDSVIDGYELFAPPHPDPHIVPVGERHYYVTRVTMTFRDPHGRTLATIYDWESVLKNDQLTQEPRWVAGPTVVKYSLRELVNQARRDRQPPVLYGGE